MKDSKLEVEVLLRASHNDTVRALLRALDLHGPGEGEHAERVAVYAVATAERMGLSDEDLIHLRRAALLHDVGKIAIERSLLCKLGDLSEEDLVTLRLHSALCESVLEGLPWLKPALPMIRHHHERFDGGGYPDGLTGADIPPGAAIIGVAETFDHLAFGSYWKPPVGRESALDVLRESSGSQFDPAAVAAFVAIEPIILPLGVREDPLADG